MKKPFNSGSISFCALLLWGCLLQSLWGQSLTKRVLFLGNSYTNTNNLPGLIASAAQSTNDVLIHESHTPGGFRLSDHAVNTTSLAKIAQGTWDFVVLQEQSQLPSFPINQVNTLVFPYAEDLNTLITTQNPCAETVFYMTWGRQNGDSQNCAAHPPVCTYTGMDDLLRERYMTMATNEEAIVSPVGAVWRYLRTNHPNLNLYSADGSHPSLLGSYAAACTFYTTLFRKDPTLISFESTLSATDAQIIKLAVKTVVYNQFPTWFIGTYDPMAAFTFTNPTGTSVQFFNQSMGATSYLWDFGDGTTATTAQPTHTYAQNGMYTVALTVTHCGLTSVTQQVINTSVLHISPPNPSQNGVNVSPNPVTSTLALQSNALIEHVKIYDASGRLVQTLNGNVTSVDFSSLVPGLYWLSVETSEGSRTQKVIKL